MSGHLARRCENWASGVGVMSIAVAEDPRESIFKSGRHDIVAVAQCGCLTRS